MTVTDEQAIAALHTFLLAAWGGEPGTPETPPDFAGARAALAAHRTLRADTLALWPAATRQAARELFMAWFIVLELNRLQGEPLPWPADFLAGTSATRLGEPVLRYLQSHLSDLEAVARRARAAKPAPPRTDG